MVLPGQFLERSVPIRSGALLLDGLYHRGDQRPPCVLASPHPALGGSMTATVIAELAWQLTQAGHATLRFDYRGVGGSQGHSRHAAGQVRPLRPPELADEAEDLLAASEQLAQTAGGGPVCAIGYSFGAGVVLSQARDARFDRLALVAPPTRLFDFGPLRETDKPVLVVCAEDDAYCDRGLLQRLIEPLGARARLVVIPESDHVFRRGLTELGHEVVRWLGSTPRSRAERAAGEPQGFTELELDEGDEPPLELDEH
jgi:alpha/beta superfamily hydrolase